VDAADILGELDFNYIKVFVNEDITRYHRRWENAEYLVSPKADASIVGAAFQGGLLKSKDQMEFTQRYVFFELVPWGKMFCSVSVMMWIKYNPNLDTPENTAKPEGNIVVFYQAHELGSDGKGKGTTFMKAPIIAHEKGHMKAFGSMLESFDKELAKKGGGNTRSDVIEIWNKLNAATSDYEKDSGKKANDATEKWFLANDFDMEKSATLGPVRFGSTWLAPTHKFTFPKKSAAKK
jgi:hypothetical protein